MASAYLYRTLGTPTHANKGTVSHWIKRSVIGASTQYGTFASFNNGGSATDRGHCNIYDDTIYFYNQQTSTVLQTNRKFRDTSGWYHIVIAWDTTQATASNRVTIYVNGVQETSFSTATYPGQNNTMEFNVSGRRFCVGALGSSGSAAEFWNGQIAHFHFIDGTSYAASTFGETDATTGIWKPKTDPGISQANYGNNGFFLKFDNSANMGLDSSGNSNNLTTSGTILQYKDTPSNNMPQLNVNDRYAAGVTNAGRTVTNENNNATGVMSTLAVDTGKWYWEAKVKDTASDTFNVGMRKTGLNNYNVTGWSYGAGAFVYAVNGYIYKDGSQSTNTGTTAAVGDIIGFIVDLDAGTVKLQKNGADMYSGNAVVTGLNTGDFWHVVQGASQAAVDFNFGDGYFGTTAITSAGSNGNGLLFEYDVPSGHYGISTKNIASNS
jgi:hypothetical protein